jgi:hypothetical protein
MPGLSLSLVSWVRRRRSGGFLVLLDAGLAVLVAGVRLWGSRKRHGPSPPIQAHSAADVNHNPRRRSKIASERLYSRARTRNNIWKLKPYLSIKSIR